MEKLDMKLNKETKKMFDVKNEKKIKKENKMIVSPVDKENNMKINNELRDDMSKMKIDGNTGNSITKNTCILPPEDKLYYLERENQTLIHNYGPELYDYSKELENISISPGYLTRHKIDSCVRTKMIDWMIEVLYAYNSDPPTLFLAIHLFDLYLSKSKSVLSNNDIHITGITCLYIASKMEDIIPLRMSHIKSKIGHNKFSEKEIRKKEKIILETIEFDIISTSTYDFIKTFIFDFCHNNREYINSLKMYCHIDCFENICLFLSKMMFHHEEFTTYKYSLKAIACIVAAFDILRSNSKNLSKEAEEFMRRWVR
jgi:hypothetical protein